MSSLYILGRAATYDDAAMVTYLSSTVIATFFHHFIVCMATWYPQWIYPTPKGPKLEDVLKQYETLGFPGCCASTDCVHIPWNNCPQGERHLYYSRYGFTSVTYSVSVDHSRRILSVTTGHPGTPNDKAGRSDITDFSYMSGPDNNIPVEECETEGSWSILRALLITHYKYAKLNNLIRWVTYTKPNE